ncbi:MAG TPA: NAD-dependent epimerase/dehydratase family protein, partial [Thermogutta sp.]|nr:NAD-dependent epimerase/dehydratase family protein [Thermogutta sp.]
MTHRALITGITGFVGRHLYAHLVECGDQVLGLAPSPVPKVPSWGRLPDDGEILIWDFAESK